MPPLFNALKNEFYTLYNFIVMLFCTVLFIMQISKLQCAQYIYWHDIFLRISFSLVYNTISKVYIYKKTHHFLIFKDLLKSTSLLNNF